MDRYMKAPLDKEEVKTLKAGDYVYITGTIYTARDAAHLIIRTPVIPTFNDTVEEIGAIADFASSLEGVSEMHILPYHKMGTDKYVGLGREYLLPDLEPPTKEHMQKLLEVVQSKGLYGQIGG